MLSLLKFKYFMRGCCGRNEQRSELRDDDVRRREGVTTGKSDWRVENGDDTTLRGAKGTAVSSAIMEQSD